MDQSLGSLAPQYNVIGNCLVEGYVFHPEVGSVVELHAWISNAVAYVTFQVLENTWHEIKYSLDILWATHGADIELDEMFFLVKQIHALCLVYAVFFMYLNVENKFGPSCT
jgi:hypothetical protein